MFPKYNYQKCFILYNICAMEDIMYDYSSLESHQTQTVYRCAKDFYTASNTAEDSGTLYLEDFCSADFAISGSFHVHPPFLCSQNARTNLFYPEFFAIFDMDENYYTKRKNVNSYEICYTLDGEGFLEYKNRKYILKKGEGFFIDCTLPHHYKTHGKSWKTTVFHFNGPQANNFFEHFIQNDNVKFSSVSCPNFELYQSNILKSINKIVPYAEYQTSCLFTLLLTDLLNSDLSFMEQKKVQSDIMKNIVEYIKENYGENIQFEQLSSDFGFSRSHFSREFKRYMGFSPKEYLLQYRIHQAKILLNGTNLAISEIGYRVGFHDESHFIQIFKQKEGITPLKFRNNYLI